MESGVKEAKIRGKARHRDDVDALWDVLPATVRSQKHYEAAGEAKLG
jgi:hypothetical protein